MTMSDEELRRRVSAAYEEVLQEPVPDRLAGLVSRPTVVSMGERRGRPRPASRFFPTLTWAHLGGMAAAVLVGIALGWRLAPRDDEDLVAARSGELVAGAALARTLDTRLAAEGGEIGVQLTFVDRDGQFCRTFTAQQVAGLACRASGRWSVVATARSEPSPQGGMRQAAVALPRPVLEAVDARIAGRALDAVGEKAARDGGWSRGR